MGSSPSRPQQSGGSDASGTFEIRIDQPPNPAPPPPQPTKRPPLRRVRHNARLAIGRRFQLAPEFGPRGVGGTLALRTVRCGEPPLRGEFWAVPKFAVVSDAYRQNFLHGRIRDGRSQLCMYHKGEKVVDCFGDALGEASEYNSDSLQSVFSCSKLVTAIVFAWLRDRGHLRYADLVTKFWPEFGAGGKADVTVTDMLRHDAGIPWLDEKLDGQLLLGTERLDEAAAIMAAQKRLYPPGVRVYHAVIQGPLLNELCRRADPKGRLVAEVFRQEIGEPLDVNVHFSLHESEAWRLVNSYTPSELWTDWNIKLPYATTGCFLGSDQPGLKATLDTQADMNSVYNLASRPTTATFSGVSVEEQRRIFINTPALCASNGMASARGLAKLGAMVVNGGEVGGVRILSQETVRDMLGDLDLKPDAFFGDADMGWTRGGVYRWDHSAAVYGIRDGAVGWAGLGGSCLILDVEKGLATSFATASMRHPATTELRWAPFFSAAYSVVDQEEAAGSGRSIAQLRSAGRAALAFVRTGPQHDKRLQAIAPKIM